MENEETVSQETIEEQTMNETQDVEGTGVAEEQNSEPEGRVYTEDEFNTAVNEAVDKRVARKLRKMESKYEEELAAYKDTDNVLRSALGTNDIAESNEKLREFYEEQGIELPDVYVPGLSKRDAEALGERDADDFIEEGFEAMEEEANRLAEKKFENLSDREKAEFNKLATTLTSEKRRKDLLSVGGSKELLDDKEFKEFSSQFNSQVSIKDIYEMYNKIKPKKEVGTPGSMQNHNPSAKKDRYTEEEISSMTSADLDDPEVWAAVVRSLQK